MVAQVIIVLFEGEGAGPGRGPGWAGGDRKQHFPHTVETTVNSRALVVKAIPMSTEETNRPAMYLTGL